jgi:hypothetical protein
MLNTLLTIYVTGVFTTAMNLDYWRDPLERYDKNFAPKLFVISFFWPLTAVFWLVEKVAG